MMSSLPRAILIPASMAALAIGPGTAEGQTWRTMTSARQVLSHEPIEVDIEYGAGTLRLEPANAPMLYEMEIRYDEERFTPVAEWDADRRALRLGVRSARSSRSSNIREGSAAKISLARDVPIDLDLDFGAGKAEIALGGISLRRLSLSTGASETVVGFAAPNPIRAERVRIEAGAADLRVIGLGNARADRIDFQGGVGGTVLDFSGLWEQDAAASVQMGVGSLTLRLPRSLGVRIERNSFLTSFSAPGMERNGNSYVNEAWGAGGRSLTIDLSAALGSIEIEWLD